MYTRPPLISASKLNLDNYIQGNDVFNSELLYHLSNPRIPRVPYQIGTNQFRPDLIAKDFYGSAEYLPILLIQTPGIEYLVKGNTLWLIPKAKIEEILANI